MSKLQIGRGKATACPPSDSRQVNGCTLLKVGTEKTFAHPTVAHMCRTRSKVFDFVIAEAGLPPPETPIDATIINLLELFF